MSGASSARDEIVAVTVCTWRALGLPLAFNKASRGSDFTWIGVHYCLRKLKRDGKVIITGKPELMKEIQDMTVAHTKVNVLGVRDLHKYVGKANYVAGVVDTWRSFLTDLYGVIHSASPTSTPPNCVWTKQFEHVTAWFMAFFAGEMGTLTREYRVSAYFGSGLQVRIITDASPWGVGGFLVIGNTPMSYFADSLYQEDAVLADSELGSPDGQQVWEALALLIALRLWRRYWTKTVKNRARSTRSFS